MSGIYHHPSLHFIWNTNIQRVLVNDIKHNILTYDDDVLLYTSNPEIDAKEIYVPSDLLRLSTWHMHRLETQILMLNYTPSPELRQRIPIDWSQKAIQYLCLAVPVIYIDKKVLNCKPED